jgi:hypothetical protein
MRSWHQKMAKQARRQTELFARAQMMMSARYWQGVMQAHLDAMTAMDHERARKAKAAKRRKKAA